jgi:hypothetical protein
MWKKLLAAGAVLAGFAPSADAFWWHKNPPVAMPGGVLQAFRSSAADPWGIGHSSGDFSDPIFATPMPPRPGRATVPCGGPLMAPVITPLRATEPGHFENKFEVIPAGHNKHPYLTKHPERVIDGDPCHPGGPCDPCAEAAPQFWTSFELLYWATQGTTVPPIVATGSPLAAPGAAAVGANAVPVFGGGRGLTQMRTGFRTEVGYWLDPEATWGVSGRFYFLGSLADRSSEVGTGFNVLNMPQGVVTPAGILSTPLYVSYPGLTIGNVTAVAGTNFIGGDVNLRHTLCLDCPFQMNLFGGYRFMHLGDNVDVVSSFTSPLVPGSGVVTEDSVRTRNYFNGPQAGFALGSRRGPFSVELQSSVALGVTTSDLDVSRTRLINNAPGLAALAGVALPPGVPATLPLAVSNSSRSNYFGVVPEVGVKVGWHPCDQVRLSVGYNFIYWSQVQRAQPLYLPGASGTTDFWAQGVSWGVDFRY